MREKIWLRCMKNTIGRKCPLRSHLSTLLSEFFKFIFSSDNDFSLSHSPLCLSLSLSCLEKKRLFPKGMAGNGSQKGNRKFWDGSHLGTSFLLFPQACLALQDHSALSSDYACCLPTVLLPPNLSLLPWPSRASLARCYPTYLCSMSALKPSCQHLTFSISVSLWILRRESRNDPVQRFFIRWCFYHLRGW